MSENVVFMDGEFARLTPNGVDLIALALVKPSGEELYLELEYDGEYDPWVEEHVLPYLTGDKVSQAEAQKRIKAFVGDSRPMLVSYVTPFDWMGVCRLFGVEGAGDSKKTPFFWVPIDFASILFAHGATPPSLQAAAEGMGVDTAQYQAHHALSDARLLKCVYERVMLRNLRR